MSLATQAASLSAITKSFTLRNTLSLIEPEVCGVKVVIDDSLRQRIARMARVVRENEAYSLQAFYWGNEWFREAPAEDGTLSENAEHASIHCETIEVFTDAVRFSCYPKHDEDGDMHYTDEIPLADFGVQL